MSVKSGYPALCGFVLFGLLIVACSSSTKTTANPSAAGASPVQAQAGTGSKTETSTKPASSLEEHQRGMAPEAGPLKEIHFAFDRYDLSAGARETLNANASWLKANVSSRVQIEGHADERGTNEYNLALGAKRAQTAKDYLTTLGIAPERLSTISYGEELPVCKEQTEECWQKNRRDRFVVQPAKPAS